MKITVNQHHPFDLEITGQTIVFNGEAITFDSRQLSPTESHVIYEHQSHHIEIISRDYAAKTFGIKVNGNFYEVAIEDQYDQLLKQMGMDNSQSVRLKELKAPMPGLVLDVAVTAGAEVNKGDSLLILEAMKMENVIKSPSAGIVKRISVKKGDKIEKNQLLVEFE